MEFSYSDIIGLRRPVHDGDVFSRRHPKMTQLNRAKIFAPFAALTGFDSAVRAKEIPYVPVAVSATEKQNSRTHITVFSIRFERRAPGYSPARATAAMNQLCRLEQDWCGETMSRLRQRGARIYEYKISFREETPELLEIEEVKPQPYIASIFSAHHYNDEASVSIVWESTEYGWLPVISSIDAVVNYGFLITTAQSTSEKSPDAAPQAVL